MFVVLLTAAAIATLATAGYMMATGAGRSHRRFAEGLALNAVGFLATLACLIVWWTHHRWGEAISDTLVCGMSFIALSLALLEPGRLAMTYSKISGET